VIGGGSTVSFVLEMAALFTGGGEGDGSNSLEAIEISGPTVDVALTMG
jgi:hypothetical protein